jgi:hypothetical protein
VAKEGDGVAKKGAGWLSRGMQQFRIVLPEELVDFLFKMPLK